MKYLSYPYVRLREDFDDRRKQYEALIGKMDNQSNATVESVFSIISGEVEKYALSIDIFSEAWEYIIKRNKEQLNLEILKIKSQLTKVHHFQSEREWIGWCMAGVAHGEDRYGTSYKEYINSAFEGTYRFDFYEDWRAFFEDVYMDDRAARHNK